MRGLLVLVSSAGLFLAGIGESSGDTVELTITVGGKARSVVIELDEKAAPQTSRNFKKLCSEGFYNGVAFHRVIPNYIAQAGDPLSKDVGQKARWGTGGPGYKVPAELGQKHVRGAVAAARLSDSVNPSKASSGSQFYVCLRDIPALDGGYTVFGKVTMGLEYFDEIAGVPTDPNNIPLDRVEIISTKVTKSAASPADAPPVPDLTATETPEEPEEPAVAKAAATASALGAAVERGLPPMPNLNATPSTPEPAPVAGATAAADPAADRGLPPMPDLATAPSREAPVPSPAAPSSADRGVPPMPDLGSPAAAPSNFGPATASPELPTTATELPEAGSAPAEPLPPAAVPVSKPKKPKKEPGFFGKMIRRFW